MSRKRKLLCLAALLLFFLLVFTACGNESGKKEDESKKEDQQEQQEQQEQQPAEKHYYKVEFLQDGQVLGSQDNILEGTLVNEPSLNMQDDSSYHYEFIGWDADGDGLGEIFPYELNADTSFSLLYTKTSLARTYHYDIYVKGQLVQSKDAQYGDYISYPSLQSSMDAYGNVEIFLGWKYDGIFDGYTYNQVSKDCRIDAYYAESQILKVYYDGHIYANYIEAGNNLNLAKDFGLSAPEGKQIKWYTDSSFKEALASSKMPTGNLTVYGRAEEIVVTVSDVKSVSSQSELLNQVNNMIINRETEGKFSLNFSVSSIEDLLSYITGNTLDLYNYSASASLKGSDLSLQLTYETIAVKSSGQVKYTQIKSANFKGYANTRSAGFSSFASDSRSNTLKVSTSDALFYALENGYKPVIDSSDTQLTALYNKMKNALITCVSDSMSDAEKARAIYEYLVLETVYDATVLDLAKSGAEGLAQYNAFYLEGVFNDHLAVCDGFSKAYACLCNMEGIECVRVTGKTLEGVNHAWNKIKINGSWYVVDVTSGGVISGNQELLTYAYFMITDAKYSTHATEDGLHHADCTATAAYDVYKTTGFLASNVSEASKMFKNFADNAGSGTSSIDIKLGYAISDMKTALEKILQETQYSGSVNFVEGFCNNMIITVTK